MHPCPYDPPSNNTILLQPWAGCKLFFTVYHLTITKIHYLSRNHFTASRHGHSTAFVTPAHDCVSFWGLVRLLGLLGCGVGAATLWRDVQAVAPGLAPDPQAKRPPWVEVDETWLSLGGVKRPGAVVLGPKSARLDLHLSGPGLDWGGWFTDLAARGVQGVTTDDDPVHGPALKEAGLDRQQCAVHMQRTVGRHIRGIDDDDLTHLDRVLLPILKRLARERPPEAGPVLLAHGDAVMQGRVRLRPEVRKLLCHNYRLGLVQAQGSCGLVLSVGDRL